MKKLNEQQKKFIREYIIDYNGQKAAIRAGYAPGAAHVRATLILKMPQAQEYLRKILKDQETRTGITADKIINELGKVAFGNLKDFEQAIKENKLDDLLANLTREQAAFISTITRRTFGENAQTTIKFHDKIKALELLCKHKGLFTEKIQIENVDKGVSIDELGLSLDEKKTLLAAIQKAKINKEPIQE